MGEAILDDVRKAARLLIYYTELSQEQDVVANIIKIAGLNWPGQCKGRWLLTGLGNYHLMGEILCRKN